MYLILSVFMGLGSVRRIIVHNSNENTKLALPIFELLFSIQDPNSTGLDYELLE